MSLRTKVGFGETRSEAWRRRRLQVDLALLAAGLRPGDGTGRAGGRHRGAELTPDVIASFHEKARLLSEHRCPVDVRVLEFLRRHLSDTVPPQSVRLPEAGVVLTQHGVARALSLPARGATTTSELVSSYRVANGVLHNPKADRRTTAGTFHVAEGGLPVPQDKRAVPKAVFAELLRRACEAPPEALVLPYHAGVATPSRTWVSLLLRPVVCPAVEGVTPEKSMEVRFFAPATLVSNLDFVESIFGNAGDPFLPENDAALDVEHWTGHTGCVILAPHLIHAKKKDLGLPHISKATDRQKRDRMCWTKEDEAYNDGVAFKVTCRTHEGVIVTVIADNYYGYCKKETKTQISYAANLYGNVEEEHAGGAVAFPSYSHGDEFVADNRHDNGRTFADVVREYGADMDVKPEGYAVDRVRPELVYVPERARLSVERQEAFWTGADGKEASIPLDLGKVYMLPGGYKLRMEKHPGAPSYRIVGTAAEGTYCHKPCTVSGGGKSEISKSIRPYKVYGPIFVSDPEADLSAVAKIIERDYADRWRTGASEKPDYNRRKSRQILSPERSLGSVIKLLTPSDQFSDAYNVWLAAIPDHVMSLVFAIKRFYRPEWGSDWQKHFSVDIVNGVPGHELKFGDRKLVGTYLRVGFGDRESWRTFKLRQDFIAAAKIQTEDDITASVVISGTPGEKVGPGRDAALPQKYVTNCEYRLFQRPDDAVFRGLDNQTEKDLSGWDNFASNFEPIPVTKVREMVSRVTTFDSFSPPMRKFLKRVATEYDAAGYVVVSSEPRIVDGARTKNPRYLQTRPDLLDPVGVRAASQGVRLRRGVAAGMPVRMPVDAVLVGRRNNPPDKAAGVRPLAVYGPIHYQELPELFMDFISSLTGKSPSTTGAGSEGALTKGPFNAVRPTADLNNAIVSYILTGLPGFSTAAGYIGPNMRVDHDVSLLVPEIWCRLTPEERDPKFMIEHGYLEKIEDFDHGGERVLASRLGYRITADFVRTFFGRVFDSPAKVFEESILRPELQGTDIFVDGMRNILEAHKRVASEYLADGTIEEACPPLKALLYIMATGAWEGRGADHPEVRRMFTREYLLASDWYAERLKTKQRRDIKLWQRHVASIEAFLARETHREESERLGIAARRDYARAELARVSSPAYLKALVGTLGADPMGRVGPKHVVSF